MTATTCPWCNSAFEKTERQATIVYCSRRCMRRAAGGRSRLRRKEALVRMKGGACVRCGYKKNLSALAFHHLDPAMKDLEMTSRNFSQSFQRLVEEANKCILLCHNCHAEEHNPHLTIDRAEI